MTGRRVALVSLLVSDYDEAIAFFTAVCGFELVEDRPEPGKRWVVVRPPGAETGLVLAQPTSEDQRARVGSQLGEGGVVGAEAGERASGPCNDDPVDELRVHDAGAAALVANRTVVGPVGGPVVGQMLPRALRPC